MKFNKWTLGIMAVAIAMTASVVHAQLPGADSITAMLKDGFITIGEPVTIKGQTFTVNTNSDGVYVISTSGVNGSATVTPPNTISLSVAQMQALVAANNPTNYGFYGTNELVARVGVVYLQNSGQAVVEIGVEKYGLLSFVSPKVGIGAAIFQGNNAGQSGTAGGVAFLDYRKIIGDVSAQAGLGGGYDNWNKSWMGVVKFDVELRQNPHIGEYVGIGYAVEKGAFGGNSAIANKGGLMVRGGINYAF